MSNTYFFFIGKVLWDDKNYQENRIYLGVSPVKHKPNNKIFGLAKNKNKFGFTCLKAREKHISDPDSWVHRSGTWGVTDSPYVCVGFLLLIFDVNF